MSDAERIEMLIGFVGMAMAEDCGGVALSPRMERVEQYVSNHIWLRDNPNLPEDQAQEARDEMAATEAWWKEQS